MIRRSFWLLRAIQKNKGLAKWERFYFRTMIDFLHPILRAFARKKLRLYLIKLTLKVSIIVILQFMLQIYA